MEHCKNERSDKYCPKIEGKVNSFQELVLRPIEACHQTVQNYEGEERDKEQEGWSPGFLGRHQPSSPPTSMSMPGAVPIPATPSMVKAVDRIAVARREAYGARSAPVVPGSRQESIAEAQVTGNDDNRDG